MGNKCLNFELLEKKSATHKQKGKIMIIGDMNGRTGKEIGHITNDWLNPHLRVPDDYTPDTQSTKRKSQDKHVKGHGKSLIEFCKSSGL